MNGQNSNDHNQPINPNNFNNLNNANNPVNMLAADKLLLQSNIKQRTIQLR